MMTKNEQVANIIAFFSVLFGEEEPAIFAKIMELHPDYIIEKFNWYIESTRVEFPWGMHPSLRSMVFQRYLDKWKIHLDDNDYGL